MSFCLSQKGLNHVPNEMQARAKATVRLNNVLVTIMSTPCQFREEDTVKVDTGFSSTASESWWSIESAV
jgi:hypothetical protein